MAGTSDRTTSDQSTSRGLPLRQVALKYGSALGSVAVATLARFALVPLLGEYKTPFITYFPAVVVAAWIGGLGTGLLAVLLSALIASYLFVLPTFALIPRDPPDALALLLFSAAGIGISLLGEAQVRARKQAELRTNEALSHRDALAAEQQKTAAILASISDALVVLDQEWRFTYVNDQAETILGRSRDKLLGSILWEIFPESVETPAYHYVHQAMQEQKKQSYRIFSVPLQVWLDVNAYPTKEGLSLYFQDVSAQVGLEEARRKSEELLAITLRSIGDAVLATDEEGRVTFMNAVAQQLTGWTEEEARGRDLMEVFNIVNETTRQPVSNPIARVLAEQIVVGLANHTVLLAKDGNEYPIDDSGAPILDQHGNLLGAILVFHDVSERRRQEQARQFLTEASEVLASSLDYELTLQHVTRLAVPHIADWCAVDMLQEDGSIRLLAIGHVDPEKVKWGYELRRKYPPQPGEPGLPDVLQSGNSEIHSTITDDLLVAAARDSEHLEVMRAIGYRSVMIVPIRSRERVLGAITFVTTTESGHDYTQADLQLAEGLAARAALAIDNARLYQDAQDELAQRRQVQNSLSTSEERFRFALANSDISVYMQDQNLRYTWVYSGKAQGELTHLYGKTDADILEPEDAARLTEIKQRVLQSAAEERHVVRATYSGQEPGYFDTLFAPLWDEAGCVIGVTGTVNTVTERRKAQDALAKHQTEIEALNARLRRAMTETHHRVKNNLQVISALVDVQAGDAGPTVPTDALLRVGQHVKALATIHDLLTKEAKENGDVEYLYTREALEKLQPLLQSIVGTRRISFQVDDIRLPIRQGTSLAVLINELVSNAVKHGEGEIDLLLRNEIDRGQLKVRDRGPGFAPYFDPKREANTGLELIQSLGKWDLGGEVFFENAPDGGACVIVTFPLVANEVPEME